MTPSKLTMITFLAVVFGIFCTSQKADAQNGPFQRLIPRGRIIQKLRDDLNDGKPFISDPFSRSDPRSANRVPAQPPNRMSAAAKANAKAPTPAKTRSKSSSATSSSAKNPNAVGSGVRSGRQPLDVPNLRNSRSEIDGAFDRDMDELEPRQRIKLTSPDRTGKSFDDPDFENENLPAGAGTSDPMKMKATVGFGMIVEAAREDMFVVTRLKPAGNAIKAGVKRGDRIISIGGVEVDSLRLYDEVTREMEGGDQLEFIVERQSNGKPRKEKMLVQFGEMPDVADLAPAEDAPRLGGTSSEVRLPGLEVAPSLTPTSRRNVTPSFAPPTSSGGLQSVLDSDSDTFSVPQLKGSLQELDLPALNGPRLNGTSSGGR